MRGHALSGRRERGALLSCLVACVGSELARCGRSCGPWVRFFSHLALAVVCGLPLGTCSGPPGEGCPSSRAQLPLMAARVRPPSSGRDAPICLLSPWAPPLHLPWGWELAGTAGSWLDYGVSGLALHSGWLSYGVPRQSRK